MDILKVETLAQAKELVTEFAYFHANFALFKIARVSTRKSFHL